jgi:methionyl-tRNA formyltransferase
MKILLWIGDAPNQRAFANKISEKFHLSGIVLEQNRAKRKHSISKVLLAILERIFLSSIRESWKLLQRNYSDNYADYPSVETIRVDNINAELAYDFSQKIDADLILVSGTRLVRKRMLSLKPRIGILNLHTGLSPYVKGGPNCTNWCIATGQYHMVGNTVMWIDEGIDSGNILTSTSIPIDWGHCSLSKIHRAVMEQAHELYIDAVRFLVNGGHSSVPQSTIGPGKTFYTRDWTLRKKLQLVWNLKKIQHSHTLQKEVAQRTQALTTIPLATPRFSQSMQE